MSQIARALLLFALSAPALAQKDAPELPSRPLGEHELELVHLAAGPGGGIVVAADTRGSLAAFRVEDGAELWRKEGKIDLAGLSIGEELVAYAPPDAAVVWISTLEDGASRSGIGGPLTKGVGASAVFCDPKDRWIWIGTDAGTAMRVVPGDVNAWSQRKLENGAVTCMSGDERGKVLAVGGRDGTITFVDPQSANVDDRKRCEGHEGEVTAVALDARGALLVSGGADGTLRLWKVSSRKQLELLGEKGPRSTALAMDPKGRWIAAGDTDGGLAIWDAKKRKRLATLEMPGFGPVSGLCAADGGKRLVAARGPKLIAWDLDEL